jgi:transcriptional antiterminator Rof (Rho-off)
MNDTPTVRCDFLDVLEESVTLQKPVTVTLRDGKSFADQVQDVVTEGGEDYVNFASQGRVPVTQIERCEPSPRIHNPATYDDKLPESG